MKMKLFFLSLITMNSVLFSTSAHARITFEPYYSVSSTKSLKPNKKASTETEKISQREEKGLRAGISFWRLLGLNLSVGQNFKTTTTQEQEIVDEYGEIDFNKEIDSTTKIPGVETKIKDTQNKAKATFVFDPGFWIFVARMKVGVTATQRITEVFIADEKTQEVRPDPTYKPHAGAGLGVRLSPRMFGMIEYNFFFYKFPETEPFEREASISFGFSI
ncbi:porin family protein [Dolichospermum sp. ST_sed1]|nr:porin family protein [Dolichospermum sp. ST_sed1]